MIKLLAKKRKTHVLSGREHAVPPDLRGAKKLLRLISRPLTRGRRQELKKILPSPKPLRDDFKAFPHVLAPNARSLQR